MLEQVISNKADWTRVAFGDVVRKVSEKVDPWESGLERYVAGEHLDTDDLRIRRWGLIGADYLGPAFHMRFKPGHVLYGSRRTYLRKVALADFEGITANTTYVLEVKEPKVLMPELLPFIMQTEAFHTHSIARSKGSVNPYVNFSDIACFEFPLPPIQEQARLVEVFSATWRLLEATIRAKSRAETLFEAHLRGRMAFGLKPSDYQSFSGHEDELSTVQLGEVSSVERGRFSHRPRNLPKFFGGPYPFAQTGDVGTALGRRFTASQTLSDEGRKYSRSFPPGSILITIAAVIAATAITTEETWCPDSVVGIVPEYQQDVEFIEYALRYTRSYLEHEVATQTAQKNINLEFLRPLRIPWPSAKRRTEIVSELSSIEQSIIGLEIRKTSALRIQKLINFNALKVDE